MTTKLARSVLESMTGPYTFAMFMRSARTTLDLSQVEMAKKLGITRSSLCDIEQGRVLVSAATAVKYAKKAGFSELVALEACLQDQITKAHLHYDVTLKRSAKK
jgi:DNA-binding XRE family transcriptional regulator